MTNQCSPDRVTSLRHLAKLLGVGHFDIPSHLNAAADDIERLQDEVVSLGLTLGGVEEVNDQLRAEVERLRAAAQRAQEQVELARSILSAIDLSWLEAFDRGPDADYGGISLGDDHKAFWRDAIAFLEDSGGRPKPPPEMTEAELMDALDEAYPALPSTLREDGQS